MRIMTEERRDAVAAAIAQNRDKNCPLCCESLGDSPTGRASIAPKTTVLLHVACVTR